MNHTTSNPKLTFCTVHRGPTGRIELRQTVFRLRAPRRYGLADPNFDTAKFEQMVDRNLVEPVRQFRFLTARQTRELPPKQWMIDQILGRGDLGMIYGAPGSGKTFVVLDLIVAACLGLPFADRFDIPEALTVAYAAGEGVGGLPGRLDAVMTYRGVDDLPGLTIIPSTPQLFDAEGETGVHRLVAEWKQHNGGPLDLLIVDTLHSASVGANENDSKDMGRVIAGAAYATQELGCAVILVHHTNKAGTGERGSTAMRGSMDAMIELREIGGGRLMTCEKLKDGAQWQPQTFDLVAKGDSVRVEWGEVGSIKRADTIPAKMVTTLQEYAGKRFTAKSLAEATGASPRQATTALNRLAEKGEVHRGLEDESKPSSNRNPWLYWIDPES